MPHEIDNALTSQLLDIAPCGVVLFNKNGHITWFNKTMAEFLGLTKISNSMNRSLLPGDDVRHLSSHNEIIFLPATNTHPEHWFRCYRPSFNIIDDFKGTVVFYSEISELQDLEQDRDRLREQIEQQTTHDPITGLPNRHSMIMSLEPLASRSRRYNNPLSIIRMKVDSPEQLDNDYGKPSGDRFLIAISHMLKDQTRWADLIGRMGNSEFLLILPETEKVAAIALAEKLCACVSNLQVIGKDDRRINATVFCGISSWSKGDDVNKLLHRANEALEASEKAGSMEVKAC